jgi:hypothetical protein
MNFIFTEKFIKRHLGESAVDQLCRTAVTPASQNDIDIMGRLGSDASLRKKQFLENFNDITSNWDHPLRYIIRSLVEEPKFWGLGDRKSVV